MTGLIVSFGLFGATTLVSFLLTYLPHDSAAVQHFLFQEHGLAHLGAYLLVTFLACVGYGAVFLFFGFFFKSPAIPALVVFGWEGIHFLLPPLLKQMSVIHYLQSLCPVPVSEGPLAILSDAPAPWVSVLGLSALAAGAGRHLGVEDPADGDRVRRGVGAAGPSSPRPSSPIALPPTGRRGREVVTGW